MLVIDLWTHFFCIILYYKNLKSKHIINEIVIDLKSYCFTNMVEIRRKWNYAFVKICFQLKKEMG